MSQVYNPELIENLAATFPRRNEPNYAWGNAISGMLLGSQIRGVWPYSSVNENGNIYDLSGQGRIMTNGSTVGFGVAGLVPYADFVAASTDYFWRADEAGLDITGGLTVGCWANFDAPSTGAATGLISKWVTVGNQRAYLLYKTAANTYNFGISSNGTATTNVASTVTYSAGVWHCIVGRFSPSSYIDVFVDGTFTANAVATPAAIFNSSASLEFGRYAGAANYFDGKKTLSFLAADTWSDTMIKNFWHQTRPLFGV